MFLIFNFLLWQCVPFIIRKKVLNVARDIPDMERQELFIIVGRSSVHFGKGGIHTEIQCSLGMLAEARQG